jgi:hypothetical protein
MHETVQFLERHGLWISMAAWIITNTWWRFPVRFALTPAGLKNIEMWRYHPLRRSSSVVLAFAISRTGFRLSGASACF